MVGRKSSLLEELQRLTGCEYLSDLHQEHWRAAVEAGLRQTEVGAYSVEEWREALRYITRQAVDAESAEAARDYISRYLQGPGRESGN